MKTPGEAGLMKRACRILIFALLALLVSAPCFPEIYKYQDENGNWHFSDTPRREGAVRAEEIEDSGGTGVKNLKKKLYSRYNPSTPAEKAAVATVTIQSGIGTGSGFFISSEGHILTNRHVIRGDRKTLDRADQAFDAVDRRIEKAEKRLEQEEKQLEDYRRRLERAEKQISLMPEGGSKDSLEKRYERGLADYKARKRALQRKKEEFESRKAEYEKKKASYKYTAGTAALNRNFTVTCKDGTKIYAYLVKASSVHDLALLKAEACITPFLKPGKPALLSQGQGVFAVGSPAGLRDTVSRGIFSGFENSMIKTDAKIYPGNSGGPLVDESGKVIGINTLKKLTRRFEGLGFAIPVDAALKEFGDKIRINENKPPSP